MLTLLTLSLTPLLTRVAEAATYYVAPNGNDSNNGSQASPWQTLQSAVSRLQPGDTLNVKAGSYKGFVLGWDGPGESVYGLIAGTAAQRITIQADPAAPPGSVIINSRPTKSIAGLISNRVAITSPSPGSRSMIPRRPSPLIRPTA